MTPSEFKAWFDGFSEAMESAPTEAQWKRIKDRVAEIDGRPVTQQVFVDRYYPTWPRPYRDYWTSYYGSAIGVGGSAIGLSAGSTSNGLNPLSVTYTSAPANDAPGFDSHDAMLALGRAEAVSFAGSN